MDIPKKLSELGFALPAAPAPVGAYLPAVVINDLLLVSGQLPTMAGKFIASGLVPTDVDLTTAQKCAAQCAVNALALVGAELHQDWDRLKRVVRIGVFVQCDANFKDHAKVANGASELLVAVLGDAGKHARAATGAVSLPMNAPVEVEFIFQLHQ